MASFSTVSAGPAETDQIARVIATRLADGDVVVLTGQLASGKTTFVKAAAAALGSTDLVTSPTFTLAQFYSTPRAPVLHIDAYRLSDVSEYRDLGLDDYVERSITLIEWGEKVSTEFPCHLTIELRPDGDDPQRRVVTLESSCPRWADTLAELQSDILAAAS